MSDSETREPQVDRSFVPELVEYLMGARNALDILPSLSPELEKHIAKRVPPSTFMNYRNLESAIRLVALELESLVIRIDQYRMIEVYPRHFSSPSHEAFSAFISHLHALRASELYLIQERGAELLKFGFHLAVNLNLPVVDQSRNYEKAFRRRFERRLRERHRLVHAHERPSMLTRLLDLVAANLDNKEAIADAIGDVAAKMFEAYSVLKDVGEDKQKASIQEFEKMREEMKDLYTEGFSRETMEMIKLIKTHLYALFSDFATEDENVKGRESR